MNLLMVSSISIFFFNDTATTEIYTLSLHDALPILALGAATFAFAGLVSIINDSTYATGKAAEAQQRSEEHTSELQSRRDLVCRLLLEKKKNYGKEIQKSNESAYVVFNFIDDDTRIY